MSDELSGRPPQHAEAETAETNTPSDTSAPANEADSVQLTAGEAPSSETPSSETPSDAPAARKSWRSKRSPMALAAWVVVATLAAVVVPLWSQLSYEPGRWAVLPGVLFVIIAGVTEGWVRRVSAAIGLVILLFVLGLVLTVGGTVTYWDAVGPTGDFVNGGSFYGWEIDTPLYRLALAGVLVLIGMALWRLVAPEHRG